MKIGFVVLYVDDVELCRSFWVSQVGMIERGRDEAAGFVIPKVGFADQGFCLQLVPKAMMKDNPDGLDLATPSMAFYVTDLAAERARLVAAGVAATEVMDHHGMRNFAFPDPEGRYFAVIAQP